MPTERCPVDVWLYDGGDLPSDAQLVEKVKQLADDWFRARTGGMDVLASAAADHLLGLVDELNTL
jgi:hypothetical protein